MKTKSALLRGALLFAAACASAAWAALPTTTISASATSVTVGDTVVLTVYAADTDGNLRYVNLDQISPNAGWYGDGVTSDDHIPPSGAAFNIGSDQYNYTRQVSITFGATGTYVFKGAAHDSAGSGWQVGPSSVTITVSPATAPTITTHPAAVTANVGFDVMFGVSASGTSPFTYQWKKAGTNITGATNSTLTLLNISTGDAANYSVTVSNSAGSATSNSASLTVNNPDTDSDGDGIPNQTETALGTSSSTTTNDSSNTQQQNVHRPTS